MPCLPLLNRLRPATTTHGLPGNATTAAHAGPPRAGQASHQKLSTLDAHHAQREVLAPEHPLAARVARVTGATDEPAAPESARRPPRQKLARLAGSVAHGVAQAMGLVQGRPQPHDKLVRYHGTAAQGSSQGSGLGAISAELGAAIEAERTERRCRAELDETDALEWLLDSHLRRLDDGLGLRARRATGVANRAHQLDAEQVLIDHRLQTHRAAIEATSDALAQTQSRHDALAHAVQADREALAQDATGPADGLGTLLRQERAREAAQREAALQALQQALDELRGILQSHQAAESELTARSGLARSALSQALQSAKVNAGELWQFENDAESLRSLKASLAPVRAGRAEALAAAQAAAAEARASLTQAQQQRLAETLASPPGFEAASDTAPLWQAVAGWAGMLPTGLARFGTAALVPSDAAEIAMQALALATGADPARAAGVIQELRSASLAALAPPPDDAAADGVPPLSPAARQTAWLLGSVPRGMQVLAQLLPPDALAWTPPQAEAMRLQLRAEQAQAGVEPQGAEHTWLAQGRLAARRALHAADPAAAVAGSAPAQRAAYHAMRNGYFSNAPGSPYDKANRQLQKLADWLHTRQAPSAAGAVAPNPLRALGEAMTLAEATALPTPRRRAGQRLREAAGQVVDWLMAQRQLLPPGQPPTAGQLALQALAEHVQWLPEETDLATHSLDGAAWQAIDERLQHLRDRVGTTSEVGASARASLAALLPALGDQRAPTRVITLFGEVQHQLAQWTGDTPGPPAVGSHAQAADHAHWAGEVAAQNERIQASLAEAQRLLHDGDPARATTGKGLFNLFRDMLEMLEWRDKLRIVGQQVFGMNAGPLSAALPGGMLGVKLVVGAQHNEDRLIEFYMGRTGLYMQIGEQATNQFQLGGGANAGYAWGLDGDHQARLGVGGTADWRAKWEQGIENGVQLRFPRLGKGRELALRAEFMDMFEHLLTIASPGPDGTPARRDWMAELLAHHPSLNMGLIDGATRRSAGTELNVQGFAGLRLMEDGGRARRMAFAASGGIKARQDRSETATTVAGDMTTIYRDSTAQARIEAGGRVTAGAQLRRWGDASANGGFLDFGRNVELRAGGTTHFCTLFLFGDEIDPTRSDRATDYLGFDAFEREVRSEWADWVQYGYGKLPADIEPAARFAVAERQLEDFIGQARGFAAKNSFATMYADKVLRPEAAPLLDAARARARLARLAGDHTRAEAEQQAFDDLLLLPGLWEPTILMLREKTKLQAERGLDFILKAQRNRIAESQRTVGQWILYEPVPHPQPGNPAVPPARRWAQAPAAATPEAPATPTEATTR